MQGVVLKAGDTVKVLQKITEGKKDRIVPFQGLVTKVKGSGPNVMFTVKQVLEGIGVERIFPMGSPTITGIEKIVERKTVKALSGRKTKKSKKS